MVADRITRASCFVCRSAEEAVTLSRFLDAHVAEMRRWLSERGDDWISTFARLREVSGAGSIGGVPGLITLWDKTQGTSFEVKGICALSSQPFLLNTANPNDCDKDGCKHSDGDIARAIDLARQSYNLILGFGLSIPVFFVTTNAWIMWIVVPLLVSRWRHIHRRKRNREAGPGPR